ncbi:MAG: stage 0 sporulation family protein [Candidatus Izimaplasma sp.]|nr:stage 0 sporulation family protein [Candidatus Izimaplasma bacterium]
MQHTVVAIQFNYLGKKYYFDANDLELKQNDYVVVETIRGLELGEVISDIIQISDEELVSPLKPVLRLATAEDIQQFKDNMNEQPRVMEIAEELIKQNDLEMKLLNSEYTLDKSKLIIYFTAEGRVDFRELVKDLANEFHVRIELRQVGARDGAKVIGGIGPCGRQTCCTTFLREFEPVTIKMAKTQSLSLNPSNISGLCGKLLCCIRYENENYKNFKAETPNVDSMVYTKDGKGKVTKINYAEQSVTVRINNDTKTYNINDVSISEEDLDPELLNLED